MIPVLHVIDSACDETQLQVLKALRERLAAGGRKDAICAIDPHTAARASAHLSEEVIHAYRRLPRFLNDVPELRRVVGRSDARILHAWGVESAACCSARLPGMPLVITLLDPDTTGEAAGWVRSLPCEATVVAGSQLIRRRLMAAGVAPANVVVIRGPTDWSAINREKRADTRRAVVGDATPVILMSGPPSRGGGQFYGLWAAAIVKQIYPGLTVLLPYDSPERRRLIRFVRRIRMPSLLTVPASGHGWPALVACADLFLMPAVNEVCTEPLAAAMAGGLVVVGCAVRSIAEIIADRSNGLLCKNAEPRALASRLLTAIEDEPLRRRLTETARGQAYEVFGARAFADNYSRLYENVLAGRPAADNVRDTAMVA